MHESPHEYVCGIGLPSSKTVQTSPNHPQTTLLLTVDSVTDWAGHWGCEREDSAPVARRRTSRNLIINRDEMIVLFIAGARWSYNFIAGGISAWCDCVILEYYGVDVTHLPEEFAFRARWKSDNVWRKERKNEREKSGEREKRLL